MNLTKMDFAKFEARVMANTYAATRRARRRRILREIAAVLLYAGLCALLTFWATGCSTIENWMMTPSDQYVELMKRDEKVLLRRWTAEDRAYNKEQNIKHRIDRWNDPLTFGMTTQEVYEKWGTASKDIESLTASGSILVWKYGESWGRSGTYFPPDTYLYFINDKLIKIVKMR